LRVVACRRLRSRTTPTSAARADRPSVWAHAVEIAIVALLLGGAAILLNEP
jgi:hypothetical protein